MNLLFSYESVFSPDLSLDIKPIEMTPSVFSDEGPLDTFDRSKITWYPYPEANETFTDEEGVVTELVG